MRHLRLVDVLLRLPEGDFELADLEAGPLKFFRLLGGLQLAGGGHVLDVFEVLEEADHVHGVVLEPQARLLVGALRARGDPTADAVEDGLLLFVRARRELEPREHRVRQRRVDQEGQEDDAADQEERALRVMVVVVRPRPHRVASLLLDEDGERQTHDATQTADDHERTFRETHLVRTDAIDERQCADDDDRADGHDGTVQRKGPVHVTPVHVVRELAAAHLDADQAEDERVQDVFQRVPDVLHRFLADDDGPRAVGEDQGGADDRENTRRLADLRVVAEEER
mmetsp:Transcript_26282/g.85041  ORF Transcript_26282/g.85041 Transcript_26282/m.85041 type:complete len:283 (+) Transcript_26282:2598-3446(+)